MEPSIGDLIYDWNELKRRGPLTTKKIEFDDETLRDGVQSPSVTDPAIEDKLEILHLQDKLGITTSDIGLPGAGPRAYEDVLRLAREIADQKLKIRANCACRTVVQDIQPIVDVSQKIGIPIEVYTFIGSSPIRQFAEHWDLDHIQSTMEKAIAFAVKEGMEVAFVTEDTTRSRPDHLDRLFRHAIGLGARRLVICDTVGHSTPDGIFNLIGWVRGLIDGTGKDVKIDWHGHNDRGLGVTNAIHAIEAGADRIHGTCLGIGERVGNAALDQVLMNLKLLGAIDNDLTNLVQYCRTVSRACHWPIPKNYPLAGADAFRTATGVHAAAIIKALERNDRVLADRVYSGVPAGWFGKEQEIEIGPMSGMSNVRYWLTRRRFPVDEELSKAILQRAKSSNRTLDEEEVMEVVRRFVPPTHPPTSQT
ncbi:MAG: 2-isopropylmalate synthase [Deltaproteobacteria bacterium]|nr:2-isopropylmalate synthase [Deltaproteobacteria bacterium]